MVKHYLLEITPSRPFAPFRQCMLTLFMKRWKKFGGARFGGAFKFKRLLKDINHLLNALTRLVPNVRYSRALSCQQQRLDITG